MKAILEFDIENDPSQKQELERCLKSLDLTLCLEAIYQYFRSEKKYKENPKDLSQERFFELLDEHDIHLEQLIS